MFDAENAEIQLQQRRLQQQKQQRQQQRRLQQQASTQKQQRLATAGQAHMLTVDPSWDGSVDRKL